MLQKTELFSGTVADNIRWGRTDATDEEVKKAAEIAQADDFISSFSDGYNTIIAENGRSHWSGGSEAAHRDRARYYPPPRDTDI